MFDKHRFEIWTQAQHPLKHTLSDFAYTNEALPGVTDVNSAINWIIKVLYPNAQDSVATPAALPATGNTLNDYRVVLDDGDGKQAGYRWEQREGDVAAKWYKVFDFDWSTDSILAAFMDITQDLYVYQQGKSDLDYTGAVITGLYAGQTINGGNVAAQNLTLRANSGDGVGAHTGYVQVDDHFRPTLNNTYDAGTSALKFRTGYFGISLLVSTMTLSGGSILDSSGGISFGAVNLVTTGTVGGGVFTGTSFKAGTLTVSDGSIVDTDGTINFGSTILTTTGTITGAAGSQLGNFTFGTGSLISASAAINFGLNNLTTTGTLNAGDSVFTKVDSDNLRLDGNTISVLNSNGNLILSANGSGIIDIQSALTTLGQTVTGVLAVTGQLNADNLRLDGNVISSTDANGKITLTPNGTGIVETSANIAPATDNAASLGLAAKRFTTGYFSVGLNDGTTAVAIATLLSFRDALVGATSGMSLFYDGSKWNPSIPDTEIIHNTLSGLTTGDAGHTQFVMLAGRSGGQTIQGGTGASEHLVLESTANVTKGKVKFKDNIVPFTDASYSGGWSGTDIGSSSANVNDIYSKGVHKGFRFENYTSSTLPSASGQNTGRAVWATDVNKIYVDVGGSWLVAGVGKYLSDTSWDGSTATQTFTVSASIVDARNAIWALHDNTNNFERVFCKIEAISATQVRVSATPNLTAGSYRLLGFE